MDLMFTLLEYFLLMLVLAFAAGVVSPLVGVGGGVFMFPVLTLLFNVRIDVAAGATLLGVIATSTGAGFSAFGKGSPANYRFGMLAEIFLGGGAILGAVTTVFVASGGFKWVVFVVFGLVLFVCAAILFLDREREPGGEEEARPPTDPLAARLKLQASCKDEAGSTQVEYCPQRIPEGVGALGLAGFLSGMLGIAAGAVNVVSMRGIMKFPLKASVATSNFVNGMTAFAAIGVYYVSGNVYPLIAAPLVLGILLGSIQGRKVLTRAKTPIVRILFVALLIVIGIEMVLKGMPPVT